MKRAFKWLILLCVVAPSLLYLRACWFVTTDEISRAVSPDHHWLAVVTRTDYPSIFSSPTRAVRIGPAGISRLWANSQKVTEIDEEEDNVLKIRWLDAHTLQVSVSGRTKTFYEKKSGYQDVAIQYSILPPGP